VIFAVLWGGWALAIETTRIGRLHPLLHLLLAGLWTFCGLPITSLAIT
jgi:hypothetical protein